MALTAAQLLEFEDRGRDTFRASHNLDSGVGAIFGGQPLVQALAAAHRTVAGWPAHHLSALFLRGGEVGQPVDYAVERSRDGRRFASRRVVASQAGKAIFDALVSFHDPEDGPHHQYGTFAAPPEPEGLPDLSDFAIANADRLPQLMVDVYRQPFPIQLRHFDPEAVFFGADQLHERSYWFRLPSAAGIPDPNAQQCLLAFLSDYWFASTAAAPHADRDSKALRKVVTVNHGIWFHGAVDTSDWLLYRCDTPWADHGRGLQRGQIYDRSLRLVASTMQETSMRERSA